jgi:hypothetical protein
MDTDEVARPTSLTVGIPYRDEGQSFDLLAGGLLQGGESKLSFLSPERFWPMISGGRVLI